MIDENLLDLYRLAEGLELLIEEYLLDTLPIINQGHTGTDISNTIIPEFIQNTTDIV